MKDYEQDPRQETTVEKICYGTLSFIVVFLITVLTADSLFSIG